MQECLVERHLLTSTLSGYLVYLATLNIAGFKNFEAPYEISFCKGLSVLVGENGVGKSAVVDAIRLLLLGDEFGRNLVSEAALHAPFDDPRSARRCFRTPRDFRWSNLKRKRLCFYRGRIL